MTPFRTILVATILGLTLACDEVQTGNEGQLRFSYWASPTSTDFNQPILVGSRMTFTVSDALSAQSVRLDRADSDSPGVLSVDHVDGAEVVFQALAEGEARLRVTTVDGASDSIDLHARVPDVHTLAHACTRRPEAAYLSGTEHHLQQTFQIGGRELIGGHHAPVITNGSSETSPHPLQDMIHLRLGSAGTTEVSSTLSDATLSIHSVTEADIDGIVAPVAYIGSASVPVGSTAVHRVSFQADGLPLCGSTPLLQVTVATPTICDVVSMGDRTGHLVVDRLAPGECTYTVEVSGSGGLSGTFTVPE